MKRGSFFHSFPFRLMTAQIYLNRSHAQSQPSFKYTGSNRKFGGALRLGTIVVFFIFPFRFAAYPHLISLRIRNLFSKTSS